MIRLTLAFWALGGMAQAHPGHLEALGGHDHVSAGILIGIAIAIGLLGALKGGKDDQDETQEEAEA